MLRKEIARGMRDVRFFLFHIPKTKAEQRVRKFLIRWYGGLILAWGIAATCLMIRR